MGHEHYCEEMAESDTSDLHIEPDPVNIEGMQWTRWWLSFENNPDSLIIKFCPFCGVRL